jgi:hypothetical protein
MQSARASGTLDPAAEWANRDRIEVLHPPLEEGSLMDWSGHMGGWWWWIAPMMLIFWGLVIWGFVTLLRAPGAEH